MKKILFFALALMAGAAWAQEEQTVQKLNVHMMDGQVVTFLLDQEPVTKFEPGKLIIQTSGDAPIMYLLENVRKYTYEGLPEGIDAPVVAPGTIMVRQGKDMVAIDGLPDKANVAIYAADGKLLISRQAVGGEPRRCLLCEHESRWCMRNHSHTQQELMAHIEKLVNDYVR